MKKNILFILAAGAAALASVSCSIEESNITPETDGLVYMEFTSGTATKTQLGDNGKDVLWSADDAIAVFDGTATPYEFGIQSGDGSSTAVFAGKAMKSAEYFALYPYSSSASFSGNAIASVLPAAQTGTAGSFASGLNPSVAKTTEKSLAFKNVASLLKITVSNLTDKTVSKIAVSADNALAGGYKVDMSGDTWSAVSSGEAANEVTLTVENGAAGDYYLVLLPGSHSNMTVTVTYSDANYSSKVSTSAIQFAAGGQVEMTVDATVTVPPFEGGSGTQEDPYLIANARHIQNMRSASASGSATYFELTADIDMADVEDWIPLNYDGPYNRQIFLDGNGHTILNFSCNYDEYPSFFGVLYGECKNIRFVNASVDGSDGTTSSSAGIIGSFVGTGGKEGLAENIYVQGQVLGGETSSNYGGIAGVVNYGTVRNCYADVEVRCVDTGNEAWQEGVGGIAGQIREESLIENCFAAGKVLGFPIYNAGGIVGHTQDVNHKHTLKNCISWQSEISGRVAVGNIAGRWRNKTEGTQVIENNYRNPATVLTTYNEDGSVSEGIYGSGNTADYADCGTPTDDPCGIAQNTLGWSADIWDFSGETPRLKIMLK